MTISSSYRYKVTAHEPDHWASPGDYPIDLGEFESGDSTCFGPIREIEGRIAASKIRIDQDARIEVRTNAPHWVNRSQQTADGYISPARLPLHPKSLNDL